MEQLRLLTMTESEKVARVYLKMVHLREEDCKKFLSCLRDPYAKQHDGHAKLHEILSTSQQEVHQYMTIESSLDAGYFTSKLFKMHS